MLKTKVLIALFISTSLSAPAFAQGGSMRNGLPPTSMDSFVYEAGGMATNIYGDEGDVDIPPFFEFTADHRINSGIFGTRAQGLTTGHSSFLPDAWGGDEWTGNEWSMSGNKGGPMPGSVYQPPPPQNPNPVFTPPTNNQLSTLLTPLLNEAQSTLNTAVPGSGAVIQSAAQAAGANVAPAQPTSGF